MASAFGAQNHQAGREKEEEEGREEPRPGYSGVPRSGRKLTRQAEERKRKKGGRGSGQESAGFRGVRVWVQTHQASRGKEEEKRWEGFRTGVSGFQGVRVWGANSPGREE